MILSLLCLAPLLSAQAQEPAQRPKPLIPPPAKEVKKEEPAVQTPAAKVPSAGQTTQNPFTGAQQGDPFAAMGDQAKTQDPWPRMIKNPTAPPFATDRPVLRVNGIDISSRELNQLVDYYRSFRPGSDHLLLIDAVKALLPTKVMQAKFAADLPAMKDRIAEATKTLKSGAAFEEVVKEFSDDSEAPTADARYTFGRETAVQPFDWYSFTTIENRLTAPLLTVYGYHVIEVVGHEAKPLPAEDTVDVRHILVMYPGLKELEQDGTDIRKWIKQQLQEATIEVLEVGLENLVPPEYRK